MHLWQGAKYFLHSLDQRLHGPKKYKGNAEDICSAIVKKCWNGDYFQVSTHHYQEFWARDFGYTVESLMKLGYKKEVKKTLAYALKKYARKGKITTTISAEGICFSFPNVYSPDSAALLFHALRVGKADDLVSLYRSFLQAEVDKFAKKVLRNGKVKRHTLFSGMRDYAKRDSSCYDHCMAILMAREAKKLGFSFPFTEKELVKGLEDYWTGTYYKDDRSTNLPTGDANALPYWLGVGKDFAKALHVLQKQRLDQPFPLAYSTVPQKMISAGVFVPNWENYTLWPFLGFTWAHAVKKHNISLAKKYKQSYAQIIEDKRTLYEVYNLDGTPYTSFFYHADEGMLWAANYLTL